MATIIESGTTSRLSDWVPLNLKGKPMYHGINETERMDRLRDKLNAVRVRWNDAENYHDLMEDIQQALEVDQFSRELQAALKSILRKQRYWADYQRNQDSVQPSIVSSDQENYAALELYTTNDGYKKVFGYINQVFRKHDVTDIEVRGAVALVELLTIDLYNFRLANVGCSKYYNFQDIVHRGLSVDSAVLQAFQDLMKAPVHSRNFSVPLAFVSTSISQERIQEFLDKAEQGKCRMHWRIHVHALDPRLLAQYQARHPDSIVTTICAMPISRASEFPNEQEVLLRGAFFQILRIYEEQAGEHTVWVIEMVMLSANRDHGSELAENHGAKAEQRKHFHQMCAATRYEICASLAQKYDLPEAKEYRSLADTMLAKLSADQIVAPFNSQLSDSWSVPRPSWIGASLSSSFPVPYTRRREKFSRASFAGNDWDTVQEIIEQEYAWQKSDWCNVPRLHGKTRFHHQLKSRLFFSLDLMVLIPASPSLSDTAEDATHGSGFTVLHQAAFSHAKPEFVQSLVDRGAWRKFAPHARLPSRRKPNYLLVAGTMKSLKREGLITAHGIAVRKGYNDLIPILKPNLYHIIPSNSLSKLENDVHNLMQKLAGDKVSKIAILHPMHFS